MIVQEMKLIVQCSVNQKDELEVVIVNSWRAFSGHGSAIDSTLTAW